ncbi:tripartite tricarboxylate transporter TctB family protein [Bacillus sp. Marseille-P3661]|uniref:tripartite tricarboxylate transporter TctB family protein n=1 Tax=Bacillus sp. Marseille-P3661 TaxID=1936234 RepID=UPI000C850FC8|nr:tripartite tricarboxylate transporter TctB family protein [Bacillus sp. Marseille-P3661]
MGKLLFNIVLFLVLIMFIIMALDFPKEARMLPLIFAIPAVILQLLIIITEIRKTKLNQDKDNSEQEKQSPGGQRIISTFFWVMILPFILIFYLGLYIGIPLYLFFYMVLNGKRRLLISSSFLVGSFIVLWGFTQIFGIYLYEGPFFSITL